MNGLIYLASPYTHESAEVMQARYLAAVDACASLLRAGMVVYSPIVHCHHISANHELPTDWQYWQKFDEVMIGKADCLAVLMIDGWNRSRGVAAEIQIAERLKKPLHFLELVNGEVKQLEVLETV